jgi:hypothetical protein
MQRVVIIGLLASVAACRDRGSEPKRQPEGSAGSAAPAAPEMAASYARLVGAKPATLGTALATLRFGQPVDPEAVPQVGATAFGFLGETEPRVFRAAADEPGPKAVVNLEIRGGKLFAFRIELLTEKGSIPEDSCAGFAKSLEAKWGASADRVWADRENRVRAALRDTCILTFERYTDLAGWIGPEPTSIVPVALVGKPAKELASRVGPDTKLDENITFREVGLGERATGPTLIDAYLHKGVLIGVGVETAVGAADRAELRERISAAFGARPTRDATTGYDVWATTVPIRMLDTPSGVRVEVGKLTP